jgi:hypothetical protein
VSHSSRILNENGTFFGLCTSDLVCGIVVLITASEVLRPFALDWLSLPIAGGALAALIPIRLKYRRKIIRDMLLRLIQRKVVYGKHDLSRNIPL